MSAVFLASAISLFDCAKFASFHSSFKSILSWNISFCEAKIVASTFIKSFLCLCNSIQSASLPVAAKANSAAFIIVWTLSFSKLFCFSCISDNFSIAAYRSSIESNSLSLISSWINACACNSKDCFSKITPIFLAALAVLVIATPALTVSFVYSTTDSTTSSKLSSTPVYTSTTSFPACFIVSKAPLKSPETKRIKDLPTKPNTSNNSINLSYIPSVIAVPNSLILSKGFSNKLSKIGLTLFTTNSTISLKTILKVFITVLNTSTTFWFFLNVSSSKSNPFTNKVTNPVALSKLPKVVSSFFTALLLFLVALANFSVSSATLPTLDLTSISNTSFVVPIAIIKFL